MSEKNSCLLVTGTNRGAQIQMPVGLIYLGTQLEKAGYSVEIHQVTDKKSFVACKEKITYKKHLFVGFSVWMGDTSIDMLNLTRYAKECGFTTVWGGKFVSSLKGEVLSEKSIDICAIGDSEETIVELAECLKYGASLSNVRGIYYRNANGEIIPTERRVHQTLDLDKYDYNLSLIKDYTPYLRKREEGIFVIDPFESQRGCLYRCRFCFHSDDYIYSHNNKKIIRSHSPEFIIEKAKELKKLTNVDYISFCDDEFWIREERSLKILEMLKNIGISIYFLRIRFNSINENMLPKICDLGVIGLACGLESGNARILKMMHKGITLEMVKGKMALLTKYPIKVYTVIILGNPTETKEEVMDSVRFLLSLRKIKKDVDLLTFFYRPLPSTDFGKMAEELGFKRPKTIEEWVTVAAEHIVKVGNQWLPWFNKTEQRHMSRNEIYFVMNSKICWRMHPGRRQSLLFRLFYPILWLLERITFYRIYYWNFDYPVDLKLFYLMRKLFWLLRGKPLKWMDV